MAKAAAKPAAKSTAKPASKTVKLVQFGSANRRPADQQATLIGLGLNRIRKTFELEDTPAVRGMIAKVAHIVRVIE